MQVLGLMEEQNMNMTVYPHMMPSRTGIDNDCQGLLRAAQTSGTILQSYLRTSIYNQARGTRVYNFRSYKGTSITVYGTYDSSSAGVQTSYSVDGGNMNKETSPASGKDTYQQQFWASGPLQQGKQ